MPSYCTSCGALLPAESGICPTCNRVVDAPVESQQGHDPHQWGFGPPALGIIALIPTALLVAVLAALIPLPVATALSATALGLIQIALVWLLGMRYWPPSLAALGLSAPGTSFGKTTLYAVGAIAGSLGFAQLYTMAVTVLGWEFLAPPELPSDLLLPGGSVVFSVFALAILTPLAEEIFFRGFVMRGLVNRWGFGSGLVVSAALFAGLHFSPALLLPVFVTGLLLGGLYRLTRSLWPCIAVHAAQNLVAVSVVMYGL